MGTEIGQFDLTLTRETIVLLIDRARSDLHRHGAMQLTLGIDGPVRLAGEDGEALEGDAVLVAANAPHWFESTGPVAVVWLAPESWACRQLTQSFLGGHPLAVLDPEPLEELRPVLRRLADRSLVDEGVRCLVRSIESSWLTGGQAPPLHPAVKRALRHIEGLVELRVSAAELAEVAGVSETYLMRQFKEGLGTPLRRVLLWQRVCRALDALGHRSSATDAAHLAGFHDLPHMSRVFKQLLELTPGELSRLQPPMRVTRLTT